MSVRSMQRLFAVVAVLALVFGVAGGGRVSAQDDGPKRPEIPQVEIPDGLSTAVQSLIDKGGLAKVVVILEQPSLVSSYVQAQAQGLELAPAAAEAQLAGIQQAQEALQSQLESEAIGAQTIFRNQRVYNGIAITVDSAKLADIASLPGVSKIVPLSTHTYENESAVELIGAKSLWNSEAAGLKYTGDGITIGVIDTGVDFLHTNFGGTGLLADYEAAAAATGEFTTAEATVFPTAKVVGGWDFAGDDYDADDETAVAKPDPIPMDCNGHGSHVAGSATGLGVNADGTTYTGPYTSALDTAAMRIGPGVAPEADLYALRVFGCAGTTNLTDMAFEWATDPNADGNLSDHLDVVNLSLGSGFGLADDSTTMAADAAVDAGVIVVTSAGNAGDASFISGSPGVAQKVISTAATVDAFSMMDGITVNSPAGIAGVYGASFAVAWPTTEPDVTGNLKYPTGTEADNTNGCAVFEAGYFAGQIALLDWDMPQLCGSIARADNATAAGAIGVVMAYTQPVLDIAITGSDEVPSAIVPKAVGDTLRTAALAGTVNVTLDINDFASVKVYEEAAVDTLAYFSSRGPRSVDFFLKPDVAAPGMTIFSTDTGRYLGTAGVEYQEGNNGVSFNGTSMASPMVAGVMALLREAHPDWTVEELKALVMNTAVHDVFVSPGQEGQVFSPTRVGAGRVDAGLAAGNSVLVYNASTPGTVSVSFGAPDVAATTYTDTRVVSVENKGAEAVSYRLTYHAVTDMPGVTMAFLSMADAGINVITVPAGGTTQFKLRLTANVADMRNVQDPAMVVANLGLPRAWFGDEAGLVKLVNVDPEDTLELRLPVYAAPRPVSAMNAGSSLLKAEAGKTGTLDIVLTGTGVDTSVGSWTGYPANITSLVTAVELGGESPDEPESTGASQMADLKAFGVTTDYPARALADGEADPQVSGMATAVLYFGIATYGEWSTPTQVEFDIWIDTNQDGTEDYVVYNTQLVDSGDPTDVHLTRLLNLTTLTGSNQAFLNNDTGVGPNTALMRNNVVIMPIRASAIGLTDADGTFNYAITTWSAYESVEAIDGTDWITYDAANPALDVTNGTPGLPMYFDVPGNTIPVVYDLTEGKTTNGLLLLHHYNATAERAEVLLGRHSFVPIIAR